MNEAQWNDACVDMQDKFLKADESNWTSTARKYEVYLDTYADQAAKGTCLWRFSVNICMGVIHFIAQII